MIVNITEAEHTNGRTRDEDITNSSTMSSWIVKKWNKQRILSYDNAITECQMQIEFHSPIFALNFHGQIGRWLVLSSYLFFYYKFQSELGSCSTISILSCTQKRKPEMELQALQCFHCFQSFFCYLLHGQLRILFMELFSNAFLPILSLLIPFLQYYTLLITLHIRLF